MNRSLSMTVECGRYNLLLYVQGDLVLNSPQRKSMIENGKIKVYFFLKATGEEEPEIYQLKDETERRTILGTLTLMRKFSMTVHTDNTVLAEHGEDNIGETGFDLDRASDEYETNQVMSLVNRTLIGMVSRIFLSEDHIIYI